MAVSIFARIHRGRLHFQVADVLFPSFTQAATAWSAAEAHRLDIADEVETLIVERTAALADMRRADDDFAAFSAASKREAQLAAQIRQLRAQMCPLADTKLMNSVLDEIIADRLAALAAEVPSHG